jgi:hypothetical protein
MSGKTEKRDCLNSSNFALVGPLAFYWRTLRLLGGMWEGRLIIGIFCHCSRGVFPGFISVK